MTRAALVLALTVFACSTSSIATDRPAASPPTDEGNTGAPTHGASWTLASIAEGAVLLGDLGEHRRTITTSSTEAQAYFDQGLALGYGFNHDEAARSFAHAAALDPKCAMCFWGVAYMLGPNYNVPMLPERAMA